MHGSVSLTCLSYATCDVTAASKTEAGARRVTGGLDEPTKEDREKEEAKMEAIVAAAQLSMEAKAVDPHLVKFR